MVLPGVMMIFPILKNSRGFTLIELLLTIGLMGLMLGLSLPRISAVKDSYFAAEEAKEIANTIRAARMDAITNRTTVGLVISSDGNNVLERRRVQVKSWQASAVPGLATENQGWSEIWDAPPIHRTKVSGHMVMDSPKQGILFFANGSSTGGEIATHDESGILQHHFRILPTTGELLVQ